MQEGYLIKTQNLLCPRQNQAKMLCASLKCNENSFICNNSSCDYCQPRHSQCQCYKIIRILKTLESKKQKTTLSIQKTLKAMQQVYDQAIDRLSRDKQYLSNLMQSFGYHEQQIAFLKMINEGNVSEVTGSITSKIIQTLNINITFQMDQQGVRKFWDKRQIQFNNLFDKFKGLSNKKIARLDSKIVTEELDLIQQFLVQPVLQFKLLFRASEYNYSANQFHRHCDNKKNTLVIAKTQYGRVIGGFTTLPWGQTSNYVYDYQGKTFLFSLTEKQKFPIKNKQYGLYGYSTYGPTFGGGHDFCIADNCKTAVDSSYFNFGHSFNTIDGKYTNGQGAYTMFCGSPGSYYATVQQYQVFEVQFM